MSDTTTTDPKAASEVEALASQAADAKAEADAARLAGDDLGAIKAEARKWQARARANEAAAARLAEIEEASKTAEQKAAERLAELEAKVKDYETREQIAAWKSEVAAETGVPVEALAGATREEIEAHAAVLKPLITTAPQPLQPVMAEGRESASLSLNGSALEDALRTALGIN